MTGRLMSRPGWNELMARVQPNDTIVLVWLDRFSRNFDEGVRIQADLTSRNIGIVAIKEGIDTTDDSAAAKYFRRMMMANGAYQADSTSERIKVGQERAKAEGRPPGRPPALSPDQVHECKRMFAENPSVSRVARIMKISWSTANKAIFDESSAQVGMQ
jgi:DNA invertase Pin-like site-specific DNA recombinase